MYTIILPINQDKLKKVYKKNGKTDEIMIDLSKKEAYSCFGGDRKKKTACYQMVYQAVMKENHKTRSISLWQND